MRRPMPGAAVCVAAALVLPAGAGADLRKDAPKEVCAYLAGAGLQAGEYKQLSKDHYFASAIKVVGPEGSPNTLSYNVAGEAPSKVTKVYLNLDVDDPTAAQPGHEAFLAAAGVLVEKATGAKPTSAVRKALTDGKDGKFKVGPVAVEVAKIPKGGGPKYVLQLLIK